MTSQIRIHDTNIFQIYFKINLQTFVSLSQYHLFEPLLLCSPIHTSLPLKKLSTAKQRFVTAEPGLVKDFDISQHVFNVPKRSVLCSLIPYVWFRFQSYPNPCQYLPQCIPIHPLFCDFMVDYVNHFMTPSVSQ